MKKIIISIIISLLNFNFVFAESGYGTSGNPTFFGNIQYILFYAIVINPIAWIIISIIIGFIIYKVIKKRKSGIENIKK